MNRSDKLRIFIIRWFGSHDIYRIQELEDYNFVYDRWDTTFSLQVRVAFIFWMNMKIGYYSCHKAYEDLVRFKKVPKKIKKRKVMNKTDIVLELLKDE